MADKISGLGMMAEWRITFIGAEEEIWQSYLRIIQNIINGVGNVMVGTWLSLRASASFKSEFPRVVQRFVICTTSQNNFSLCYPVARHSKSMAKLLNYCKTKVFMYQATHLTN
ncbi:hypothetical protein VSP9026_00234 [Vibrio spartinae]|uniref:Uncharacterized protein n=1 Tax=Vibrio spartinae TaxID=1918945 RepID=A0A1N6LZN0_9VIBR|nr:hypothetical protein VSP9026_00234 [Vibrio spartinae]